LIVEQLKDAVSTEIIGIDHIYVAVSDLGRSESLYDRVTLVLGFRKNTFTNDGDHQIQYYNRHPASSCGPPSARRPDTIL